MYRRPSSLSLSIEGNILTPVDPLFPCFHLLRMERGKESFWRQVLARRYIRTLSIYGYCTFCHSSILFALKKLRNLTEREKTTVISECVSLEPFSNLLKSDKCSTISKFIHDFVLCVCVCLTVVVMITPDWQFSTALDRIDVTLKTRSLSLSLSAWVLQQHSLLLNNNKVRYASRSTLFWLAPFFFKYCFTRYF